MRLKGKTALITGCNRGIGKAIVRKFALEGANIICAIRKENPTFEAETDRWGSEYGVSIKHIYFDLADEDSIKVLNVSDVNGVQSLLTKAGVENVILKSVPEESWFLTTLLPSGNSI